ncbi:MAG: SemiSWEET transporter [Candidatus Omnitrophota bacterium]
MITSLTIGLIAGFLCTVSFLPQVIKVFKTKQTKDLSLVTFSVFTAGVLFWLIYGIMEQSVPIIITNVLMSFLSFLIVMMKLRYK